MASIVNICNMALAHIGDNANISSLEEQSVPAEKCKQFYDTCLDMALEAHNWSFATKRTVLSAYSSAVYTRPDNWDYAYIVPPGVKKIQAILNESPSDDAEENDYQVEELGDQMVIYTNVPSASMKYTMRVTETGRFSGYFTMALSFLLGSFLAGPIIGGKAGTDKATDLMQKYLVMVGKAAVLDANQSRQTELTHLNMSLRNSPVTRSRR